MIITANQANTLLRILMHGKTMVLNSLDKTTVRVARMSIKCDQFSNRLINFIGAN